MLEAVEVGPLDFHPLLLSMRTRLEDEEVLEVFQGWMLSVWLLCSRVLVRLKFVGFCCWQSGAEPRKIPERLESLEALLPKASMLERFVQGLLFWLLNLRGFQSQLRYCLMV